MDDDPPTLARIAQDGGTDALRAHLTENPPKYRLRPARKAHLEVIPAGSRTPIGVIEPVEGQWRSRVQREFGGYQLGAELRQTQHEAVLDVYVSYAYSR